MAVDKDGMVRMEAALMRSGEMFTDNFQRFQDILDTSVPILGRFTIDSTSPGFPPEEIREEWVGLTLPVRFTVDIEQIPEVPIIAAEALHALDVADKNVARDWWRQYYADEAKKRMPNIDAEGHDDFLANISFLVFDPSCGTLIEDPNRWGRELLAGLTDAYYFWDGQREWRGTR